MRGRLWFLGGLGVGYVLGTRAGRERFDQIVSTARRCWESPTVQEAAGVVQAQANRLYEQGKQVVGDKLHRDGAGRNGHALEDNLAEVTNEEATGEAPTRRSQFQPNAF